MILPSIILSLLLKLFAALVRVLNAHAVTTEFSQQFRQAPRTQQRGGFVNDLSNSHFDRERRLPVGFGYPMIGRAISWTDALSRLEVGAPTIGKSKMRIAGFDAGAAMELVQRIVGVDAVGVPHRKDLGEFVTAMS